MCNTVAKIYLVVWFHSLIRWRFFVFSPDIQPSILSTTQVFLGMFLGSYVSNCIAIFWSFFNFFYALTKF